MNRNQILAHSAHAGRKPTGSQFMLSRIQILMLFVLLMLLTAIALIVLNQHRENEFSNSQFDTKKNLLVSTSQALSEHVNEQRKQLQNFVLDNHSLLVQLRMYPQDAPAYSTLQQRMALAFPAYANFTIIDERGNQVWMDIDSEIGSVCKNEIQDFRKEAHRTGVKARNPILIHPVVYKYHYDLMALLAISNKPALNNVFFVSFHPEGLAEILKSHQSPGHQLMLVKKGDTSLIEVTAEGARDKIKRDIYLTDDEMDRLETLEDVDGTNWRIVDLEDESLLNDFRQQLWRKAISIASLVFIVGLFLVFLLNHLLSRKSA